MCGIVGFYGKKNILNTLISGLKRLEYRGYDSAGVAIHTQNNQIYSQKSPGKVSQLEEKINQKQIPNFGTVGIAHTRWATHGEPSEVNSHPQFSDDNNIAVVHNGIIENYKALKQEMIQEGVKFHSSTDTEIISNLINKYYEGDLKVATLKALERLKGAFAIGVISKQEPDRLIGAKKGSPMVIGVGENEIIIASDVSAIISTTKNVIYLEDGELVDIGNGQYNICDFSNRAVCKQMQLVDWNDEQATKEGWDHFLIKEIMEQSQSVVDSKRGRLDEENGNIIFGGLLDIKDRISKVDKIVLLGIGTSYYSCKMGELYFEELAKVPTKCEMSPEFKYKSSVVDENTWVIALSQSGETADTISAIQEAKQKGALVTGIVNTVGSTISRITDAGVYNHIGPEISVASTKAFTSQVLLLLMHAIYLARIKNMSTSESIELIKNIQKLPDQIKETLKQNKNVLEITKKYQNSPNFLYIGRKYNHPIAMEGALKLKEISYIHAEGLSGGELKHGFIALVDDNHPTFAIATSDSMHDKICSNIEEVKARKGKVITIIDNTDTYIKDIADDYIIIPQASEFTQPILSNIIFQLFAYHASNLKGLDVDKPRNLAKSVTVE